MGKKQPEHKKINRSADHAAVNSMDFTYDFSRMSLDELLESVRADIDPGSPRPAKPRDQPAKPKDQPAKPRDQVAKPKAPAADSES